MTGALVGAAILVALALGVAGLTLLARSRAPRREPGAPDELSHEVAGNLLAELRKAQAEAAYWQQTAQRLQRELDQRSVPPPGGMPD